MADLKSKLRASWNQILYNRLTTSTLDRLSPAKSLGARGEIAAERHLLKLGHIIVDRGFNDGQGEIDLITVDADTVVFVEVKTRTSDLAGMPVESVDENKQYRITRTAISFMKRHDLLESRSRFDVISIEWPNPKLQPKISHFENAFEASERCW